MAKVKELNGSERIKAQTRKYIAMVVLGAAALVIFLWFAFVAREKVTGDSFTAIGAVSILVFAACAIFAKRFYTDQTDTTASLRGEKAVCEVLGNELGDEFEILKNVKLASGGKTMYVDLLVVGPTGVFPLTTKNEGTKIEAVGFKRMWKVSYLGVTDNDVTKKIPNPLMQADAAADAVREYMKDKKAAFSAAVYPMVIFTVPGTGVHTDSIESKTPMCVLDSEIIRLRNHILNRKRQLDADAVQRTLALFGGD